MRLRAVRSFVWQGRDVDVGETFDASLRDAHILVAGYGYCVPVDNDAPVDPPVAMTVAYHDPIVKRRRGVTT
jgi:hypothetical protein